MCTCAFHTRCRRLLPCPICDAVHLGPAAEHRVMHRTEGHLVTTLWVREDVKCFELQCWREHDETRCREFNW